MDYSEFTESLACDQYTLHLLLFIDFNTSNSIQSVYHLHLYQVFSGETDWLERSKATDT
jgi:hypothetical protein